MKKNNLVYYQPDINQLFVYNIVTKEFFCAATLNGVMRLVFKNNKQAFKEFRKLSFVIVHKYD